MKQTRMKYRKLITQPRNILRLTIFLFLCIQPFVFATNLFAATSTYVPNSSTGLAYEGATAGTGTFNGVENQFIAGEYSIVSTDGADYVQHDETAAASTKYQYHEFDFTIAEDPAIITQLQVTWKGFGGNFNSSIGTQSFTGETEVETATGPVSFEDLYETFVTDPSKLAKITYVRDGAREMGRIRAVKQFSYTGPLTVLTLSNGKSIKLTPYHEVLVNSVIDEYHRADELTVGTKLVSLSGEEITVAATATEEFNGYVYDLTVEEFHNFLLAAGVFVHNTQLLDNYGHSLWVKESGTWTSKASGVSTTKETLTATYTTNIANIISSGHFSFGAYSNWPKPNLSGNLSAINTYYAQVVVTYSGNTAPAAPSSLGPASYVNGSTVSDTTPTLNFTQSDVDGSDQLKFQIQIDDTSDFSSPVVDYTSALGSQGAATFTVGQAAGSGTYTAGSAGTPLADATNYYWRVRSNDNTAWGNWATANSGAIAFVLIVNPTLVTSTADTNTIGTLRYVLNTVSAGQTITFDATTFPSGTPATINVTSALPVLNDGTVTIDATGRGVILNGSGAGAGVDGLSLQSAGNVIINLQIKSFTDDGIAITASGGGATIQNCQIYSNTDAGIDFLANSGGASTIKGCYIGMNSSYTDLGNGNYGINVNGTAALTIGGAGAGDKNYIGFHNDALSLDSGIYITQGTPTITGNYIGTNAAGASLGNDMGIYVAYTATSQINIGSTSAGLWNVISRNVRDGIFNESDNTGVWPNVVIVSGCYIGTDTAGTASWPNGGDGIEANSPDMLGTMQLGSGNVIGPNTGYGIHISGGMGTTIEVTGNIDVNDDIYLVSVLGDFSISDGVVLNLSGNLDVTGNGMPRLLWNNSTIVFDGTTDQTFNNGCNATACGTSYVGNMILNNTGAAGSDDILITDNLLILGDLTITDGDLDLSNAANPTVQLQGNLTINNTADPNITRGGGTWTFMGSSAATVTDNTVGLNLGAILLNKTNTTSPGTNDKLTLGSNVSLISISVDGTAGSPDTLALGSSGYALSLTGNGTPLTINAGATFDAGTNSTVKFQPAATTGVTVPALTYHHVTFSKLSNTFSLAGPIDVNGNLAISLGELTTTASNHNINVGGNWSKGGGGAAFTANGSTVTFDGTTTQTFSGAVNNSFANLTIDNTGANGTNALQLLSNLDVDGQLRIVHGALDFADASATLAGSLLIESTAYTITRGVGTWTFDGNAAATITDNTAGGIDLGNITLNKTNPSDSTERETYLGSNVKMTSVTVDGTFNTQDTLVLGSSGYTLTLTGNGSTLIVMGTFSAGTNSTVKFASSATTGTSIPALTYHNIEFAKASNIFTLGGAIDVNGNLTITAGTLDVVLNSNYGITVGGSWSNLGIFSGRAGTVTFDGGTTPVTVNAGSSAFYGFTINKSLPGNIVAVTTNNLSVAALNITSGTLDFSGTALDLTMTTDSTIGANGRFSKGTGKFRLNMTQDVFTDNSSNGPQNLGKVEIL